LVIRTNGSTSVVSNFSPSGRGFQVDNSQGRGLGALQYSTPSTACTKWQPDPRKSQAVSTIAVIVKF
jgi:hypothetical protein